MLGPDILGPPSKPCLLHGPYGFLKKSNDPQTVVWCQVFLGGQTGAAREVEGPSERPP